MGRRFCRVAAAAMAAMGVACVLAQGASAHGFHCRRAYGWDPAAGVYHWHTHPGICRDYQGCLRKQRRCIFLLGRGFEAWTYESFGRDNRRFTKCMIRSGCY